MGPSSMGGVRGLAKAFHASGGKVMSAVRLSITSKIRPQPTKEVLQMLRRSGSQ